MRVSPIFASGYLVLLVCSLHVDPSHQSLLPLAGECSHCYPWFREFKDPQRSERRCRTISMCCQEQPGHSLFETGNRGSGRWVTLALSSSSAYQLLMHTWLACINPKYHIDVDKNILGCDPKGRRRERKGKQREKQRKFVHTCSHCWLMVKGAICGGPCPCLLWWDICLSEDSQICFSFWLMVSKMPPCFLFVKSHQTHGLYVMACENGQVEIWWPWKLTAKSLIRVNCSCLTANSEAFCSIVYVPLPFLLFSICIAWFFR